MTYQTYSSNRLFNLGISRCKKIAQERGIVPTGDKRQLFTWVEAILNWQESFVPVQPPKEKATILFYCDVYDLDGYAVSVDGVVIRDGFRTYARAEAWAKTRYEIINQQQIAQNELENYIEEQATEVTASGDEKQDYPEKERPGRISVIDVDFGHYEVLANNNYIATIDHIVDLDSWQVNCNGLRLFNTYQEAIEYVEQQHEAVTAKLVECTETSDDNIEANIKIESVFTDEFGGVFAVFEVQEYGDLLIGHVRLNHETGWTSDFANSFDNWYKAASGLVEVEEMELICA